MCTALRFHNGDTYFGRNLDYDISFLEEIVFLPRAFPLSYRFLETNKDHYAILGMAHVEEKTPLFYDAFNEKGLGIVGLNFVSNAYFPKERNPKRKNVCQYEFLTYLLSTCQNISEVKKMLNEISVIDVPFSEKLPNSSLHYLVADEKESIVLEFTKEGLKIYPNEFDCLTNNPPFDKMSFLPNLYMSLSTKDPKNTFSDNCEMNCFSRGMGGMFLPGDLSSTSRFIRASFALANSKCEKKEESSVSQFFHILKNVEQPRGLCEVRQGSYEITIYSSCMNLQKGIYYYTTYENPRICSVRMKKEELQEKEMRRYPLLDKLDVVYQN